MTDAGSRVFDGNTVSGPSSCEEPCAEGEDWTRVGAACYLLSPDMMGWHAAQQVPTSNISLYTILIMCIQFCSTNGGHLVEILSQEHEDILDQSVFSGLTYWIGLNDIATEGIYTIM